jgi:hypothetical protein
MKRSVYFAIGGPLLVAMIVGPCWFLASEWPGGMRP